MATFRERLDQRTRHVGHYLCIGLDPELALLPAHLPKTADGAVRFNREIIAATNDIAACYKPNVAFYEALGVAGWQALLATYQAIPPEIPVIADAKRGDVGNTAAAYARAMFGVFGFECVTLSPYMGEDSVAPFLAHAEKTVLLLARTSNPGSKDFQECESDGVPLFLRVVRASQSWSGAERIGYVVGATYPADLARVRDSAPDATILVPGVGAQGGKPDSLVCSGKGTDGGGLVINVSRAILYAGTGPDFASRAREAAISHASTIQRIA
jgi:orotidine-5'-phosphate decarboxylase